MRPPARFAACVLACALAACASYSVERTPEERKAAWDAGNSYPAGYRPELIAYLRTYLNDPTGIREAAISEPALKSIGQGDRFVSCVRFDAKKAGGGYSGVRDHAVIYVGGKLDRFVDKGPLVEPCRSAAYAAFPELEQVTR